MTESLALDEVLKGRVTVIRPLRVHAGGKSERGRTADLARPRLPTARSPRRPVDRQIHSKMKELHYIH